MTTYDTLPHRYMITASIPFLEEWKKEGREVPAVRDLRGSYYVRQERTGTFLDSLIP